MAGLINRAFSDDLLNRITDPRNTRGRSWKQCLPLLRAALLGLACGCKGLQEVERLTTRLSKSVRKLLGIHKRVPDTTMRDFLRKISIDELQELLYVVGYDAWRRETFQKRRDFFCDKLDSIKPFRAFRPQGAFYVFVNIRATGLDSVELAKALLEQAHVAVVPGEPFGSDDHVRMGFATSEKDLEEAARRLAKWCDGR